MSIASLVSLITALIIVSATPGPGVILTITRSLQGGIRAGIWVTAGIVLMDILVLILTLSGLSLMAYWSQPGLVLLQFAGAIFLIWLAWQNWHRATMTSVTKRHALQQDFLAGVLVSLTNPVFFYLAFLPAFIDISTLSLSDGLLLIGLIGATLSLVLLSYAFIAASLQSRLLSPQKQRWMNRLSALVLLGLAIWLVWPTFSARLFH